jgi:hypothetical protein
MMIIRNEIEAVIEIFSTMKHPEMDGSKAESNQMFEEELT